MRPYKALMAAWRASKAAPFAWGSHDCLTLCADVARLMTGVDPMKALRGRYKSALGARRVMQAEGWAGMGDVAASMYPAIPVAQARAGDWALIVNENGTETLGVVAPGGMVMARTEARGIGQVRLSSATRAYRVA